MSIFAISPPASNFLIYYMLLCILTVTISSLSKIYTTRSSERKMNSSISYAYYKFILLFLKLVRKGDVKSKKESMLSRVKGITEKFLFDYIRIIGTFDVVFFFPLFTLSPSMRSMEVS